MDDGRMDRQRLVTLSQGEEPPDCANLAGWAERGAGCAGHTYKYACLNKRLEGFSVTW